MDAPLIVLLFVAALCAGAAVGWFLRAGRGAADLARAQAELAAARDDRDRQYDLYRDAVEHTRAEQRAEAQRVQQQNAVLTALAPVRESLQQMQQKVSSIEQERHAQFGSLAEQLRRAQESDEALRATTESLAGALRSTATRGVWGETQLRRVVEAAGLTRHVDAKVPLDAYLEASALPGGDAHEAQRRVHMQKHVKALRAHIDALAKKAYWSGLDSSPEFVICFLPSESLLAAAIDEDPTLLDYAFSKRVALASPVNLWAVLKTVAYTWTQQEVSTEASALLALGTQLYDRLGTLAGHADDLRRALERTVESYNKFAGSLENRVLVTARQFPGIDATTLDAEPQRIIAPSRRFTAPELVGDESDDALRVRAEIGDVRDRVLFDDDREQ
jgi:DNA recombination protein RmuC